MAVPFLLLVLVRFRSIRPCNRHLVLSLDPYHSVSFRIELKALLIERKKEIPYKKGKAEDRHHLPLWGVTVHTRTYEGVVYGGGGGG